jgi:hypothetical protein
MGAKSKSDGKQHNDCSGQNRVPAGLVWHRLFPSVVCIVA